MNVTASDLRLIPGLTMSGTVPPLIRFLATLSLSIVWSMKLLRNHSWVTKD